MGAEDVPKLSPDDELFNADPNTGEFVGCELPLNIFVEELLVLPEAATGEDPEKLDPKPELILKGAETEVKEPEFVGRLLDPDNAGKTDAAG